MGILPCAGWYESSCGVGSYFHKPDRNRLKLFRKYSTENPNISCMAQIQVSEATGHRFSTWGPEVAGSDLHTELFPSVSLDVSLLQL